MLLRVRRADEANAGIVADGNLKPRSLLIRNVHLPATSRGDALYDVYCKDGKVHSVSKSKPARSPLARVLRRGLRYFLTPEIDAEGKGLLLPSLCHAHVHLDKCFLLDQCGKLESGTFKEALELTTRAKAQFPQHLDDVYARGRRLIVESIACGVTAMRAHVEVDTTVQLACLDVALRLKAEFAAYCDVQISAFAQDPLFERADAEEPGANYTLLRAAARTPGVACVGSAPYVERTPAQATQNIALLVALALAHGLHADFHLDYNIDASQTPLVYALLAELRAHAWAAPRVVTIGHGTRYSLFDGAEWDALRSEIGELPVAFVALPQSDMYMMGKGGGVGGRDRALLPPRATLPVPYMASLGLRIALSVNNVDNAFTPQGSVDPMGLCPLGVAVYQDAGEEACRVLMAAVSSGARRAVGLELAGGSCDVDEGLEIEPGDRADFVLLHDNSSARAAVLDPCYARSTIRAGRVIATRRGERWACFDIDKGPGRSMRPAYVVWRLCAGDSLTLSSAHRPRPHNNFKYTVGPGLLQACPAPAPCKPTRRRGLVLAHPSQVCMTVRYTRYTLIADLQHEVCCWDFASVAFKSRCVLPIFLILSAFFHTFTPLSAIDDDDTTAAMSHRPTTRSMTARQRNQPQPQPWYYVESVSDGTESGSEYQPSTDSSCTYTAGSGNGNGTYEWSKTQSSGQYRKLARDMTSSNDPNTNAVMTWFATPVPAHDCDDGVGRQPSITCTRTDRAIWAGDKVATERAERWAVYAPPAPQVQRECERPREREREWHREPEVRSTAPSDGAGVLMRIWGGIYTLATFVGFIFWAGLIGEYQVLGGRMFERWVVESPGDTDAGGDSRLANHQPSRSSCGSQRSSVPECLYALSQWCSCNPQQVRHAACMPVPCADMDMDMDMGLGRRNMPICSWTEDAPLILQCQRADPQIKTYRGRTPRIVHPAFLPSMLHLARHLDSGSLAYKNNCAVREGARADAPRVHAYAYALYLSIWRGRRTRSGVGQGRGLVPSWAGAAIWLVPASEADEHRNRSRNGHGTLLGFEKASRRGRRTFRECIAQLRRVPTPEADPVSSMSASKHFALAFLGAEASALPYCALENTDEDAEWESEGSGPMRRDGAWETRIAGASDGDRFVLLDAGIAPSDRAILQPDMSLQTPLKPALPRPAPRLLFRPWPPATSSLSESNSLARSLSPSALSSPSPFVSSSSSSSPADSPPVPPLQPPTRRGQVTPLFEVKLEDVINRKHLPPLGLKDFEEWLLFVEGSPENLYFMLWLREYTARYIQWEAGADLKSPPPPSPSSPTNYRFSTPRVPDSALSLFYARAKQTFFMPNADYELNVPSDIISRFHSHYASPPYPHPNDFHDVAWEVHGMLQESLDRFVVAAYQNVGTNRALCGIIGGITFSLLGTVAPIACNFVGARSRWLRLTALPGLWLGLTILLASLHGVCMMVYIFGDLRQLRKFELARPRISAPKIHIQSEKISRPIRPSFTHSRSVTSLPATIASLTPTRSAPSIPTQPSERTAVPQLKLDIPAPPPAYPAPPSSSSHTASAFASISTPYEHNRSTSSLASSGSASDVLSDKHDYDDAHAVTISDAYYDANPAPEGPATRTGPGAALPIPPVFGGAYKFGNPDPRYHTRECRANRACRVSRTAGFIHPYDSVDDFDKAEFRAGAHAASAMEQGMGLPFGLGLGMTDGDEFDFDALPARGFGPGWDSDDGSSCICPMTPAIASSVALPSTRPQSSQTQTAMTTTTSSSPSSSTGLTPIVSEKRRFNAVERQMPLEAHPSRCTAGEFRRAPCSRGRSTSASIPFCHSRGRRRLTSS
ncbi:hypothetical protein EVG20_g4181, partial [Dentipellis fragilis]